MFSAKHLKIGIIGEEICCRFLKKNGWKIISRNYRKPWGEIDVIAIPKNGPLVFIEVKTLKKLAIRQNNTNNLAELELKPEDNLTQAKLLKLKKICAFFANNNPALIDKNKGWRMDLISIILNTEDGAREDDILTNIEKHCTIKYYENIF